MGELFVPGHLLIILLVFAAPILGVHFIPTIIAGVRGAKNFWWIFAIDMLLAWTLVGWVVALVWALRDEPKDRVLAHAVAAPPYNL